MGESFDKPVIPGFHPDPSVCRVAHESLNHYSKGAVISFLYTHVAGIRRLDGHPAYSRFRVAPQIDPRLTNATATFDSPRGRIVSAWNLVGDQLELNVTVPPGAEAEVELPDGRVVTQSPGTQTHSAVFRPSS